MRANRSNVDHKDGAPTVTAALNLRRVGRGILWLLLAGIIALAAVMVLIPRLMGWVPLTILTGSMEPTIPTGSQVVVETIEGDDDAALLAIGDVITFMPRPDDPTLVTHRIVGRTQSSDGAVSFTTQGDANNAADPWTLTATQIRGVVEYHVPYAGYLANALSGHQKSTGVTVAAVALFAYGAVQLVGALRARRTSVAAAAAASRTDPITAMAAHGRGHADADAVDAADVADTDTADTHPDAADAAVVPAPHASRPRHRGGSGPAHSRRRDLAGARA
ncbi:signal peptidase I [Georgenia sp. SYP-B2076]|uniref:signal peptidase I n=1 Tax=Georgenia sp. SYP-B2076 TaxID=2495881 RepID=UPI000F8CBD65|nr:signal peptidase I [Georgenia sp. SYP-B2076]